MPKQKNAKRKHYVAPWTDDSTSPLENDWKWLADGVTTAEVENDEESDDVAYYNGDGTPETVITSVKYGYSFEGDYIKEDEAQKIIADMRFSTGDQRKVWFKVIDPDGKTQYVAPATVSDIKIGGGEAAEYEGFSCTISWNTVPKQSAVVSD
ncbi:phage tail tube protein [Lactococcus muris]|uniref:phage tail tube protein n=1 Tax=Lactococcus muris TaxID=2941330 RepID=UPI002300BF75